MSHDHFAGLMTSSQNRPVRFSILSAAADVAEVQDFIQRLTESDDAFAQRQRTDRPDDASAEPPRVEQRR